MAQGTLSATTTADDLFARHRVIDVDTHLTEPPGVWTDRVASKWGDAIPHIERVNGEDIWVASGNRIGKPGLRRIHRVGRWRTCCDSGLFLRSEESLAARHQRKHQHAD